MTENEFATQMLDAAFLVYTMLGPKVFESVYEVAFAHQLRKKGFVVEGQKAMPSCRRLQASRSVACRSRKTVSDPTAVEQT